MCVRGPLIPVFSTKAADAATTARRQRARGRAIDDRRASETGVIGGDLKVAN